MASSAWEASLIYFKTEFAKNENLRVDDLLRRGLPSLSSSTSTSAAEEASAGPWNKPSQLSGLLLAAASFAEDTEQKVKDDVIVKVVLFGFVEAGYNAVGTLAFVAPEEVLPRLIDQLRSDMDQDVVNALTESDFGIWETPEGTTYVDVLTSKGETKTTIKGKDAELAKWDEETKQNIASKKAAASKSLTKQQQALVDAQLKQEAKVRQHVVDVQARLFRGLRIVRSLVQSDVEEFRNQISLVASLILKAPLGRGSVLVGEEAFQTYLVHLPSEGRFGSLYLGKTLYVPQMGWCGGLTIEAVPEQLQSEPLNFSNTSFPRELTIEKLLHVIKLQSKLSKEASSTLVDIGGAIQPNASQKELSVLLQGTLAQDVYVQNLCLQTLQPFDLTDLDWSPELMLSCHDEDEQNARLARHLWDDNGLDVPEQYLKNLLDYLDHKNAYVRSSTAAAIGEGAEHRPQTISAVVGDLQEYYREKAKILAPEYDEYAMVIASSLDRTDPWPAMARLAVAQTLKNLSPTFTPDEIEPLFQFLVKDQALGDRSPDVRRGMLNAATTIIDLHGADRLAVLISFFENHLAQPSPATETDDQIKEAVIILFGRVARHLDSSDSRIPTIVDRLVEDPLSKYRSLLASLVDQLLDDLFNSAKYGTRRGAAYGLAAVLKGAGISGMKEFNVIARLRTANEDKKRYEPRPGVTFAFETLSSTLGRLFEPYITYVLPLLLFLFGDGTLDVREATQDAARIIMGNLSAYGVKLILPTLLEGLDKKQWRTKKGSIELLRTPLVPQCFVVTPLPKSKKRKC
ncbi:hypothetical protein H0H93_001976 [Arthromyces matolae]|nr:hypothetical protein H0H93_001976 [Arthromyces matolae]